MIYPIWRLSEDTPDNLGLAFTDDGLLLGRTPLIERRGGRFVVRDRAEIERLLMYSFPQVCPVERIMTGLARIAAALNANDQATARFAAVHLQIPDLPSVIKRNAMIAEDALIKYARDQGGDSNWNPALHPRAGMPPNPGWFAPTDDGPDELNQGGSRGKDPRLRLAENEDPSRRADAAPIADEWVKPSPGNPIDEPAAFAGRFASSAFGPTFGQALTVGCRSRCLSTTLKVVRWWESGRVGKLSHLISEFRLRLLRSWVLRHSRPRSRRGWVSAVRRELALLRESRVHGSSGPSPCRKA